MKTIKLAMVGGLLAGALTLPAISAMADDHDFRVPPGHLPPAGQCRIWYPGTPPGRQPPAGDCRILSRQLPAGALLISHDRVWRYNDRPAYYYSRPYASYPRRDWHDDDDRYPRYRYDRRGYYDRDGIRHDFNDLRDARKSVRDKRDQLGNNVNELKKDRAELRKDIRNKADAKEIRQHRQEIRDDARTIATSRKDVRQSQNKLNATRRDLREDLGRR